MKYFCFILIFAVSAMAQNPANELKRLDLEKPRNAPTTQETEKPLIPHEARFSPDARVELSQTSLSPELRESLDWKPSLIQVGSINGVRFRFYFSDGSGAFEGQLGAGIDFTSQNLSTLEIWSVGCEKDKIDDTKSCTLVRGDLFIFRQDSGRTVVRMLGDQSPGSSIAIRVDGGRAFTADAESGFVGKQAEDVIQALGQGQNVVTRYIRWPEQTRSDREHGLYGFKEALAYLDWALKMIK